MTNNKKRNLRAILIVGLAVVAAAAAYIHFWLTRPIGDGPAGPAVDRASFQATWTERPVLLLGIGDSITAGLGADSREHSYFERLTRNPADEFPAMQGVCLSAVIPNLTTVNLAVSGSTSLDHAIVVRERLPEVDAGTTGIVVMTTGGNDLIHNYGRTPPREGAMYGATLADAQSWIDNFEHRLNEMLDMLDEHFAGNCQVFLADIYDPTDGVGDAPSVHLPTWPDALAIHAAYSQVIHRIAEQRSNVHLVPMHREFLGHGSHCRQFWRPNHRREDPHYWFYENIEDPNDRGYDAIRRLFLIEMARILPSYFD